MILSGIIRTRWYALSIDSLHENTSRLFQKPNMNEQTASHLSLSLSLQMTPPLETWFKALVWSEVVLQLPFFVVGAYAFATRKNFIRTPCIIYGSFVCATMVPILTVIATHAAPGYAPGPVFAFYLPYLLIPASLVFVMVASPVPFSPTPDDRFSASKAKGA